MDMAFVAALTITADANSMSGPPAENTHRRSPSAEKREQSMSSYPPERWDVVCPHAITDPSCARGRPRGVKKGRDGGERAEERRVREERGRERGRKSESERVSERGGEWV